MVKQVGVFAECWHMAHARLGSRTLTAAALAFLATGLWAAWVGLRFGGAEVALWVDDVGTALAALTACVLCFRACARHTGRMRTFWALFGCAMACFTLAEVIWGVYALILSREVPVPSWADVGYLTAIPLAVAGLVVHPAMRGNSAHRARLVLDGTVIATALLFLSWTLVLGPLWRSSDLGTFGGIVGLAYPFGDVVIVFFIVLAIRGMTGAKRLSLWCLLAALLVMAVSDSTYTYLTEVANYSSAHGNLIDVGWFAAYLGIAIAALSSEARAVRASARRALEALARVTAIAARADAARAERPGRGAPARRSPRSRLLADGSRADRAGARTPGAAALARCSGRRPGRQPA